MTCVWVPSYEKHKYSERDQDLDLHPRNAPRKYFQNEKSHNLLAPLPLLQSPDRIVLSATFNEEEDKTC